MYMYIYKLTAYNVYTYNKMYIMFMLLAFFILVYNVTDKA